MMQRALIPTLGKRMLAELTPFMLEEAFWPMGDPTTGKGRANAQRSITILKKALAFARKNSWMEKNPLADVDTDGLYTKSKEPDALEVREVDLVRQALLNWAVPGGQCSGPTSSMYETSSSSWSAPDAASQRLSASIGKTSTLKMRFHGY